MVCRSTSNLGSERLGSSAGRRVDGQSAEGARASLPDQCEMFSSCVGTFDGRYKWDALALSSTECETFEAIVGYKELSTQNISQLQ